MSDMSLRTPRHHQTITDRDVIKAVLPPREGDLRTRKVISRSKTRPTEMYPSWKMGRMMHSESPHELNAFRLLDANPEVGRFEEQPVIIVFVLDGIERIHYPDVRVMFADSKELWEVKTRADAEDPEVARRTELMIRRMPDFGYSYRMVIGEELQSTPRLANAKFVLRTGRREIPFAEREHLRRLLACRKELSWSEVRSGVLGKNGRAYACRLMLEGALRFDMDKAITGETIISVVRPSLSLIGATS